MLKQTVTYTDFNGEEVTEDLYFHLSEAELVEMELSHEEGLSTALQRIIDTEDGKEIIKEFKAILLGSFGKKSPDGKRFVKNAQIREEFESSEAYSTFFMSLVTDAGVASDFINGVMPRKLVEAAAARIAEANQKSATEETPEEPAAIAAPVTPPVAE